jgi:hypothetical protein
MDLTSGYSPYFRIVEVIQPKRQGDYSPRHNQIVLTYGGIDRVEALDFPGNPPAVAYNQTYNIRCHVIPSEKDPTPINEMLDTYAAEVMRVVCDAGSQWYSFGSLAIDANFQPTETYSAENGLSGINVPLVVTFRHSENNPFEAR